MFNRQKRRISHFPVFYRKSLSVLTSVLIVLAWGCGGREGDRSLLVLKGTTMGTTFSIKIVKPGNFPDGGNEAPYRRERLEQDIDGLLLDINRKMSTYMEDSEISRFNRSRSTRWFPVSGDTVRVIREAREVSEKSGGAFDITVGPLVNLWGFGPQKSDHTPPGEEEIQALFPRIGYRKVAARPDPPALKKEIPDVYCDLSAIAKGYGVDRVAEYLDSGGIADYLVEIGGEIRARGKNRDNRAWRIGIAVPENRLGIQKVILLDNLAMATSGDYRNYFEKGGVRYSHTIDPRTGRPITHPLASVTVIHRSCMTADALATAIDVLGPGEGFRLALTEDLSVFLIIREKRKGKPGFIEKMTPGFKKLLAAGK